MRQPALGVVGPGLLLPAAYLLLTGLLGLRIALPRVQRVLLH